MNQRNTRIENQYHRTGIYEEIIRRLKEQGIDLNNVSRSDISGVDEFHIRDAQVSKELADKIDLRNMRVLDIGCGLGGPCRMLVDEFGCHATGIDMSHEFIRTAQKLSELVGLDAQTDFVQGDALNLPFEDGSFDVVWTQHVQMNIEDKEKLYAEIKRVLKAKGAFIYYDIFKKGNGEVHYPVPWANDASISFLATIANMEAILVALGFAKAGATNETKLGIEFFNTVFEKMRDPSPQKLGLNILMGDTTKEKLGNVLKGLEDDQIELQSGVYKLLEK